MNYLYIVSPNIERIEKPIENTEIRINELRLGSSEWKILILSIIFGHIVLPFLLIFNLFSNYMTCYQRRNLLYGTSLHCLGAFILMWILTDNKFSICRDQCGMCILPPLAAFYFAFGYLYFTIYKIAFLLKS